MLNKIIDDIFNFELGDVFEGSVDFLVLESSNVVAIDFGSAFDLVFSAHYKPVLKFDSHVL